MTKVITSNEHSPLERLLSMFARIRPGEGWSVLLLTANGFLVVCAYYVLKTLRESLILSEFDAETKSYAMATVAVVLIFLMPLYGVVFRHTNRSQLVHWISAFFIVNLVVFTLLSESEISIAFSYYVWVGIFGVMVVAQFWAYAADIFNVKSGQRIFPIVIVGTSLGALAGSKVTDTLFESFGVSGMMLLALAALAPTIFLYRPARIAAPEESRCIECEYLVPKSENVFGGLAIVAWDPYLRLIAVFIVLLNCINSTGEYVLAVIVSDWSDKLISAGVAEQTQQALIASFYADYNFWVTISGLLVQILLVSKILRHIGMRWAILFLPVVAALGYGLITFLPIFGIVRAIKIAENALDNSLMSTIRHALFLPTSREVKFEGKTTIDTFFWRFGDLLQAGVIFAGVHWLNFGIREFAVLNFAFAMTWIGVATVIGREYSYMTRKNTGNTAPVLNRPIPDLAVATGSELEFKLNADTFVDTDPGDHLSLSARQSDGSRLPHWLRFDKIRGLFRGRVPHSFQPLEIRVTAHDTEGLNASGTFRIFPAATAVS